MTDPLGLLVEWAVDVVEAFGYVGVALLVALTNLFPPLPPLPSEVILPLSGFVAGQGQLSLLGVILAATIGSLTGSLIVYGLSRWIGEDRLRRFVRRHGRFLLSRESALDRSLGWFDQHGGKAVLFGRLVPVVRSAISVPAGLTRMPLGRFILYTTIGSLSWNTAFILIGWFLGYQWDLVHQYSRPLGYGVVMLMAAAVAWLALRRRKQPA
jgi:membrane protein DedA with SNARE-associated domain